MKRLLRRLLAIAATALAIPAAASTITPHYTDLWWLPSESGWGVNVIQQYDTMFVTLFVYGPDNQPHWYVGPAVRTIGASQTQFTGPLYSTVGSPFGVPWAPAASSSTQVGTVTFNFTTPTSGTMTYTVNNTTVTKAIVRQTWAGNVLHGNYIGGITANGTNCRNNVPNGAIIIHGELTINHTSFFSPTFRIDFVTGAGTNGTCSFIGLYQQEGRLGSVANGSWACQIQNVSNPPAGTFSFSQIEATQNGLSGRFTGSDQNCNYDGYFGGIRDVL
jgi:hypothetical protein